MKKIELQELLIILVVYLSFNSNHIFGAGIPRFPTVNGTVTTQIEDGSGGWFLGGTFTSVDNITRNAVVHIKSDYTVDQTWNPVITGSNPVVECLELKNNMLFIGGTFDQVSGLPRLNLAAVNATTGEVLNWRADVTNDPTIDGTLLVKTLTIDNNTLYIGGQFRFVSGLQRNSLAAIDVTTGQVLDFSVSVNNQPDPLNNYPKVAYVKIMTVSANVLYIGGWFSYIGAAKRNSFAAVDLSTFTLLDFLPGVTWADKYNIGTIDDMILSNNTLYLCGYFEYVANTARHNLAAIDVITGEVLNWDAKITDADPQAHATELGALDLSNNVLYIGKYGGGDFIINGTTKSNLAALNPATAELVNWNTDFYGGAINTIKVLNGSIYVGGSFPGFGIFNTPNWGVVDAYITNPSYTIQASAGANGNISPYGLVQVQAGADQTFTIVADPGYYVSEILIDGSPVTNPSGSYTFTAVSSDHSIKASFALISAETFTLTATAGSNGSITPAGTITVPYNSSKTYTVAPSSGYHIRNVMIDGKSYGAISGFTITNIARNHVAEATFAPNQVRLYSHMVLGNSGPAGHVTVHIINQNGEPIPSINPVVSDASGQLTILIDNTPASSPSTVVINDQTAVNLAKNSSSLYQTSSYNPELNYDYMLFIDEPLGYTADKNPVPINAYQDNVDITVDLSPVTMSNQAKTTDYWKYQFNVYIKNKGTAQESSANLQKYIDEAQKHYSSHYNILADLVTFNDWYNALNGNNSKSKQKKAKAEIAALVLNFASLKLGQFNKATQDNVTAGEVLTYVSCLYLSNDSKQLDQAQDYAEKVNEKELIKSGKIPHSSELYKGSLSSVQWDFGVPSNYMLYENFPNPFNPSTTIRYELPKDGHVALRIYDITGKEVAVLVDEDLRKGTYETSWNALGLASGIYFYRLQVGEFVKTNKMILLK